jgi:hypothetical protein
MKTVIEGHPTVMQITVQADGGMKTIVATRVVNATIVVAPFTVGTTSPVLVTATKIDHGADAAVTLQVTDVPGNSTICDPELVSLTGVVTGKPVSKVVSGVAQTESTVAIHNNSPGLKRVDVTVNGQLFKVIGLRNGEVRTIDVAAALKPGNNNTVVLTPRETTNNGTADVVISDLANRTAAQNKTNHVIVARTE